MNDAFRTRLSEICTAEGWELEGEEIAVPLGQGRQQLLGLRSFEFEGQELVRLSTTVGDATRIDATRLTQALRVTLKLPHGAFALDGDQLVLVDTVSTAEPSEHVAAIVRYLVETADHFEKTMFGGDRH